MKLITKLSGLPKAIKPTIRVMLRPGLKLDSEKEIVTIKIPEKLKLIDIKVCLESPWI